MSEEMIPIGIDDILSFRCSPKVSCFNDCCRDLNQFLTPYDILRLKKNLCITSDLFLKKYTSRHNGPESGLPVITFKSDPASGHACPFVKEFGCSVYEDRPASCRMYPLARAIVKSRQTSELKEYFALIQEPHCKGFIEEAGCNRLIEEAHCKGFEQTQNPLTVGEWLQDQNVELHNKINDKLMEIISLKNRIRPGKLDGVDGDKFYLACYDLDTFRTEIFKNRLLNGLIEKYNIPPSVLEKVKVDDVALLELGMAWIKNILFGIKINIWN